MYYYAFPHPLAEDPFAQQVWCVLPQTQANMEIAFRADPKKFRKVIYQTGALLSTDANLDQIAPLIVVHPEKKVCYNFKSEGIDKIEAIKNLRTVTNLPLSEAKKYVEFLAERKATLTLWMHY